MARLLYLRHLGLSYAELAETLGLAPGSIGKLLARAHKEFERRYCALEREDETPNRR
jgi:DNA-directed RNA polymerase specialized sigma24 family protein